VQPLELANTIEGHSTGLELLTTWQATLSSRFRLVYNLMDIQLEDTQENDFSPNIISLVEDRALRHQLSLWGSFDLSQTVELDLRLYYSDQRSWASEKIDAIFNGDLRLGWQALKSLELSLVGHNLLHSAKQDFITESWSSPSLIERSVFLKGIWSW